MTVYILIFGLKCGFCSITFERMELFRPYTDPQPLSRVENKINLNVVMLHIKLKGKKYRPTEKQRL